MSAIAKPHLFFNTAVTPQNDVVIPVDWIMSMDKVNEPASPQNNNKASWFIVVTMVPVQSATKVHKIRFAAQATRDTAFGAAKTLIAASV